MDLVNSSNNRAMTLPDFLTQAKTQSLDLTPISPEQFAKIIRNDVRRYAQLAKAANIKAE
jgi:tripartite-type tricarboxylate transporter receptor subunit TctC